jgi:hypothetical protein
MRSDDSEKKIYISFKKFIMKRKIGEVIIKTKYSICRLLSSSIKIRKEIIDSSSCRVADIGSSFSSHRVTLVI